MPDYIHQIREIISDVSRKVHYLKENLGKDTSTDKQFVDEIEFDLGYLDGILDDKPRNNK